uniref:Uncharacterized protein n=1 Tax=Bacillus cereus HuA4-10 TaxID=1053206 RepID=J8D487_BACCE|nr:hypothetical protein IGC_04863 [Bacillus cereus HuA4-10]
MLEPANAGLKSELFFHIFIVPLNNQIFLNNILHTSLIFIVSYISVNVYLYKQQFTFHIFK